MGGSRTRRIVAARREQPFLLSTRTKEQHKNAANEIETVPSPGIHCGPITKKKSCNTIIPLKNCNVPFHNIWALKLLCNQSPSSPSRPPQMYAPHVTYSVANRPNARLSSGSLALWNTFSPPPEITVGRKKIRSRRAETSTCVEHKAEI